jgi:hypothetical protein
MGSRYHYAPLTTANKEYLRVIAGRRWKTAGKRFLIVAILPMTVAIAMLFIANLIIIANLEAEKDIKGINIPEGIEHFSLLWYTIPIFFLLLGVNLIMFIRSIPPLYIDIWNGKKRQLLFTPQPYTLEGSGNYYINTGLPAMRFIEVSYEQYMKIDYKKLCFLEVAPFTNIPLGFKTVDAIE